MNEFKKELKCPKCGQIFSVSEADYALLLNSVKTAEFNAELASRLEDKHKEWLSEQKANELSAASEHQQEISKKERELQEKDAEIGRLNERINAFEQLKTAAVDTAVLQEQKRLQEELQERDTTIQGLLHTQELEKSKAQNALNDMREGYENQIKLMEAEVARYKDFKARLSTKMVGETLEQHCFNEFLRISSQLPHAEFHKDNENVVGDDGKATKGDFIFRDYSPDGVEYISIMFEMKNEDEESTNRHNNQYFFHKLDEDRRKKNCEYAVLVSMLEPENELYNEGIVPANQNDKGEKFEKMYVIRPQFFAPLITFLAQANSKSLEAKRELALVKAQQIDVTNFETRLKNYQTIFGKHVKDANARFNDAVKDIDKAIENLMDIRDKLTKSSGHLADAEGNLEELTNIKKLTKNNPTMQALFAATGSQTEAPLIDSSED